jgi:TonB family protein
MGQLQPITSENARPGAMTMAMKAVEAPGSEKVLRIGILRAGNIVEERVIRRRESVTVGSSEKNHFIIQRLAGMPSRFALFQLADDEYILNFTAQMSGRVALPGGVQRLDDLRNSGGARNAGDYFQIKLSDQSRGKITIGETTVLFQFVSPPPPQPKPMLPASVRGGFGTSVDWTFTSFIVASFLLFFGSGLLLESIDPVVEAEDASLPPQFARLLFVEPQIPDEPEEIETEDGESSEVEEAPVKAPSKEPSKAPSSAAERAEATARIVASVGARAESLIMGVLGEGGALSDALAHGAVTGNALDVLASAAGVQHADGASSGQIRAGTGGGGSGQTGNLGEITASGQAGKQIATRGPVEKQVTGRVRGESGAAIGGAGEFDGNLVLAMVKTRTSAIKACYDRALRTNPTAEGRVKVEFTIQPNGTVSGARAVENTTGSDEVATCVVSTVERFRFNPGPSGGSVTFSYPFIFQLQN